jgi:hypothetical protein
MAIDASKISYVVNKPRTGWRKYLTPPLLAVFSFRHDHHLVQDLVENITPYVDGWVSYDDRNATGLFSNETERQSILIETAAQLGGKWILAIDPDERLECGAVQKLRGLTRRSLQTAWTFHLRELYGPQHYRTDGLWGKKHVPRLFPAHKPDHHEDRGLHAHWFTHDKFKIRNSGINLYHLKMISPARRVARRDLYKALDPHSKFQTIGYEYLTNEETAEFETIPYGREYHPAHCDDGETWMSHISPERK